jgi:hypothetical protein
VKENPSVGDVFCEATALQENRRQKVNFDHKIDISMIRENYLIEAPAVP